jgi:cytochrome c-type biogenesis protein CcmH/NrfG
VLLVLAAAGAGPREGPPIRDPKAAGPSAGPRSSAAATTTFDLRLQEGIDLLQQGRRDEAFKIFDAVGDELRRYVRAAPNDAKAWQLLGQARMYQSYDFPARQAFERAIALEPKNSDHRVLLGRLYRYNRRWGEAAEEFRRAVALAPGHAEAWTQLGEVQAEEGKFEEALASLGRAIALRPDNTRALVRAGVIQADLGRTDEAIALFGRAAKVSPKETGARFNLGRLLQDRGEAEKARVLFREVVAVAPGDWQAWSGVVQTSEALGDRAARDEARAKVLELHRKGAVGRPSFCRDRFTAAGRKVLAMEMLEGAPAEAARYRFQVVDESGERSACDLALVGPAEPGAGPAAPTRAAPASGPFRLEARYSDGRRLTYPPFDSEPTYEAVKRQVIAILEGHVKPASGPFSP